jgi:hypothetical protein
MGPDRNQIKRNRRQIKAKYGFGSILQYLAPIWPYLTLFGLPISPYLAAFGSYLAPFGCPIWPYLVLFRLFSFIWPV